MTSLQQAFRAHHRVLWDVSRRLTGSAADADDVVQETFRRAMENPPRTTELPWLPWLMRVAVNLSHDVLRRRKRWSCDGAGAVEMGPPADDRYELLQRVTLAFLIALERLTPRARSVLLLRDVFDYSVREVAIMLEMSEDNVKQTHHRARERMRNCDVASTVSNSTRDNGRRAVRSLLSLFGDEKTTSAAQLAAVLA